MRKIILMLSILVLVLSLVGGAIACKSESSPTPEQNDVQDFADPATETTLQGLSENNLAKYTHYANADFKAALTQDVFDTSAAQIGSQLGNYESIQFLSTEEQEGYIIVHYKARYSQGEVGVRMVFDQDHLIAGQWFE
jgi:hypothetical protein